jgi:hypothetical protein
VCTKLKSKKKKCSSQYLFNDDVDDDDDNVLNVCVNMDLGFNENTLCDVTIHEESEKNIA